MTVSIQAGDYAAVIHPTRGANCISLRNSRYQAKILREPNAEGELDNPYLYGMPVLYPVNRISGGTFEFEGKVYRFPINEQATNCHLHGMLHETRFDVMQQGVDFVVCVFDQPYLDFPHRFRMEIGYRISETGLEQTTKITNLSEQKMPNFLGFHTTFCVPFLEGTSSEDIRLLADVGEEIERDMRVYLPTGKILSCDQTTDRIKNGEFRPFEKVISRNYKVGETGRILLRDVKKKVRLVYETDEKFGWRLFYNGSANEYICLEPMTCAANCQNSPFDRRYAGFDFIEPHETKEYRSKIYLEEEF